MGTPVDAFLTQVREGVDERAMETTRVDAENWWSGKVASEPAPLTMGEQYRAMNYGTALPENWVEAYNRPARAPKGYQTIQKPTLADYAGKKAQSPALPKDGESDNAYARRWEATVRPNLDELPEDVAKASIEAYEAALGRLEAGNARADTRKSGEGIGISGEAQTVRGLEGAKSYRDITGSRDAAMMAAATEARDQEQARQRWLRSANMTGYERIAGTETVSVTNRRFAGNQGMFG